MMVLALAACEQNTGGEGENKTPETVVVTSLNGAGETVEVTVPYSPQRIAVLDMAALDILDNLGLGDRVVGSASTSLDYLQSYVTSDSIAKLGSIKEADMEAVMACEPDIIFMGGRMSESYDALSEIAPVVRLTTDTKLGVLESTRKNAKTIASIFGKEAEVDEKFADFDGRIAALKTVAEGKPLLSACAPTAASMSSATADGVPLLASKSLLKTFATIRSLLPRKAVEEAAAAAAAVTTRPRQRSFI